MRYPLLRTSHCSDSPSKGYIGKKYLQQAIDTVLSEPLSTAPRPVAFSVLRVPFFLEPTYDESRVYMETNRDRLVQKWGGSQGWERQKASHDLKGRGRAAGIPHFNLDRRAANSMASHRLIQHVGKTYGLAASEAIYDVLNVYYFVEGHSLNDRPRLAAAVAEKLKALVTAPPSSAQLEAFLDGQEGRREIKEAVATLQQLGIHSIPKFIVEGQTVVDGAAHADVFVRVFREIEARGKIAKDPVFADILGVSPEVIQQASHTEARTTQVA
jgi:predicted DsbA family dithiol-disulfide isomerase